MRSIIPAINKYKEGGIIQIDIIIFLRGIMGVEKSILTLWLKIEVTAWNNKVDVRIVSNENELTEITSMSDIAGYKFNIVDAEYELSKSLQEDYYLSNFHRYAIELHQSPENAGRIGSIDTIRNVLVDMEQYTVPGIHLLDAKYLYDVKNNNPWHFRSIFLKEKFLKNLFVILLNK